MVQIILHPDFYKRADNLAALTARIEEVFLSREQVEHARALLLRAIIFAPCATPEEIAGCDQDKLWQWTEAFIDIAHSMLREVDHPAGKLPEFESGKGKSATDWEIAHAVPARTLEQLAREAGAEPGEAQTEPDPWDSPRKHRVQLFPNRSCEPVSRRLVARRARPSASRAPPSNDNDAASDDDSAGDGSRLAGALRPPFFVPGDRQ